MKILHVFDHSIPLHSGYTFRSQAILHEQHKLGWETEQITSAKHTAELSLKGHEIPPEEDVDGLHFYRTISASPIILERLPLFNQLSVINTLYQRLSQILPAVRPDIIHAHSPALNGVAAIRAARKYKIPLVYEVRAFWEDAAVDHGTCREGDIRYRTSRMLETYVMKRADEVTCICEGLRGDIVARGIPSNKVTVIPNAVDIDFFHVDDQKTDEYRAQFDLSGKSVLGFIGSFYAYEGLTLLLEALQKLIAMQKDFRLLLVGGGYEEQRLKQQVERMNLTGKVIFTGRVPHEEVSRYYDLIDILVYPRLSMRLTDLVTPLKPLEAMAQGRLIVASDVGGHRELINDGKTGYLFRAGNVGHLTEVILQLVESRNQWPAVREAARRFVERERNWQASTARYKSVYQRLVGNTAKLQKI
jgi:PEP-CTERM/exosortase A-associated glycosyltransferase